MVKISMVVDKLERDMIFNNARSMNVTVSEYMILCHAEYCKRNNIVIADASRLKILKAQHKDMRRFFFFFKNALQALFSEIEWQLRLKNGVYDAERALMIIDGFLKEYEVLPEYVKKALSGEHKEFLKLKDPKYLEAHVAHMRPPIEKKMVLTRL